MVGSDHFHQLWLDNMPQFLVGKAPFFDANFYNEEREFGLPRMTLPGQEDLASHILRNGLDRNFDLAFSNELRIDHSITCPIITLRPQADLPIVPIYTNIFAPPLPSRAGSSSWGGRSASWWRAGRRTSGWRSSAPVTCRWSSAVPAVRAARTRPGLRQEGGGVDRHVEPVRVPGRGDPGQPAPARQRHPRVHGLHVDGCGGENVTADHVDTLDLFHTMEAYFTWYPNGVPS